MLGDARIGTSDLPRLLGAITSMPPAADDAERIDRLRHFEELKAAVSAAQAREAAVFDASQRAEQAARGVPAARQGRGIAAQVALALRVSPARGQRWLGWAKIVTSELPHTYAELSAGRVSEWKTMLLARETATLAREDRARVDRDLAPRLAEWGDSRVDAETRRAAYRLDARTAVERARRAETDRRVTIRPIPDTMCRLSMELTAPAGIAAYAALAKYADTLIGTGRQGTNADGTLRTRGQVIADSAVELLTGQATAGETPVELCLLMTDQTLLAPPAEQGRDEPAHLLGYGPVPAGYARDLALRDGNDSAPCWLRRLYRHPDTGQLAAMDSHRREFTAAQRHFLALRDQTCRTPYCDAPMRHADHLRPHADGGPTTVDNGRATCVACNHAKQAPGWRDTVGDGRVVTTRTPTGHLYDSRPPDPPRATPPRRRHLPDYIWVPLAA